MRKERSELAAGGRKRYEQRRADQRSGEHKRGRLDLADRHLDHQKGTPQITPIVTNSTHPRRDMRLLRSVGRSSLLILKSGGTQKGSTAAILVDAAVREEPFQPSRQLSRHAPGVAPTCRLFRRIQGGSVRQNPPSGRPGSARSGPIGQR
jgi:hypothetical protein